MEHRIEERFSQAVAVPPSAVVLAPAALYLTAILEYVFFFCLFDCYVVTHWRLHALQGHVRVRAFDK